MTPYGPFSGCLVSFLHLHGSFKKPCFSLVARVWFSLFHFSESQDLLKPWPLLISACSPPPACHLYCKQPWPGTMKCPDLDWAPHCAPGPGQSSDDFPACHLELSNHTASLCPFELKGWYLMFPPLKLPLLGAVRATGACRKPSLWLGCLPALPAQGPFNKCQEVVESNGLQKETTSMTIIINGFLQVQRSQREGHVSTL